MNKHALNGLINDIRIQLQWNVERLNHHLSLNERALVLDENEAIQSTITKLQDDLKDSPDVGADALDI